MANDMVRDGSETGSMRPASEKFKPDGTRLYTPLQMFFITRMERLLRLREEYEALLRPHDWENKLLHRAIYSTYCDCLHHGVGREAREQLAGKRGQGKLDEAK